MDTDKTNAVADLDNKLTKSALSAVQEGLNKILREGVFHVNMMIDVAMEINAMARMQKSVKKLGWKAIESLINF